MIFFEFMSKAGRKKVAREGEKDWKAKAVYFNREADIWLSRGSLVDAELCRELRDKCEKRKEEWAEIRKML